MKCDRNSTLFPRLSSLSVLTLGLCINTSVEATAQTGLVPDQTLGNESSRVQRQTQPTPTDLITGGARRGQNLFHSFQDFNVETGQSVFFSNPNGVNNILTRVTGSNISNIDSVLGVRGDANLFIINPNGIIFGPESSLDLGGSFVATTADALQLNEQDSFSASSPQASSLLSIQPSAFFFNQVNAGQITSQSQTPFGEIAGAAIGLFQTAGLGVTEGKSLILVGGNINLDGGGLNSINGRIDIASVQPGQTLKLNITDGELSLESLPSAQAGDINLQNTFVSNAGPAVTTAEEKIGLIRFQGRNLELTDSSITNIIPNISNPVEGSSTGIILTAQNIELEEFSSLEVATFFSSTQSASILIQADQFTVTESSLSTRGAAQGTDGDILINVENLFSLRGGRLDTESANNFPDSGQNGDIEINTGEFIANTGEISTSTTGPGNAGDIRIDVQNQVVLINSEIRSQSNPSLATSSLDLGEAGDININAAQLTSTGTGNFITTSSSTQGNAGNIGINVEQFSIDNTTISTSTFDQGNAGNITLNIRDKILLDSSQIFSDVEESATGDAGDVTLSAAQFTGQNGAVISSSTSGQGDAGNVSLNLDGTALFNDIDIFTTVGDPANGNGGDIEITAQDFTAQDLLFLSANTSGEGNAGNITFDIEGRLLLDGFVQITSEVRAEGRGNGGDISITADRYTGQNRAFLSTRTSGQGNAGNVIFNVADEAQLNNSDIFSEALSGAVGNAGDIEIETGRLTARNNSALRSETFGTGNAGNVIIQARESITFDGFVENVSQFPTGILSNVGSDAVGRGGNIDIQTQQLNILNGAEVSAETFGTGIGGNVNVTASEEIELRGIGSQLSVASVEGATGRAGSLNVEANSITVADGAQVTVSAPQSQAGILTIQANSLALDRGILSAETGDNAPEGANIDLQISELLILENESLISANALSGANGGNILLDSPLIIALPPDGLNGSDIIANADAGQGGNIGIVTQGLFGIASRDFLTPLNDITASSNTNLPGEVSVQTSEVDPSDNLSNLPIRSPEVRVVKTCSAQQGRSDFVVSGRGGLPPSAHESLGQDAFQVGLVTLDTPSEVKAQKSEASDVSQPSNPTSQTKRSVQPTYEAQGWRVNPKGQLMLVANNPTVSLSPHPTCQG